MGMVKGELMAPFSAVENEGRFLLRFTVRIHPNDVATAMQSKRIEIAWGKEISLADFRISRFKDSGDMFDVIAPGDRLTMEVFAGIAMDILAEANGIPADTLRRAMGRSS